MAIGSLGSLCQSLSFRCAGLSWGAELDRFLKHLHGNAARKLNDMDDTIGRDVWYNFWETKLTYERSYLARLNYVHQNPVKHGLVRVANQYQWCSAAWFNAPPHPHLSKQFIASKQKS